eukprot:SAG31_NODE_10457_length_1136_cov_1.900675_2_plen_70_part_00
MRQLCESSRLLQAIKLFKLDVRVPSSAFIDSLLAQLEPKHPTMPRGTSFTGRTSKALALRREQFRRLSK